MFFHAGFKLEFVIAYVFSPRVMGQVFKEVYKRARLASVRIDGKIVNPEEYVDSVDKRGILEKYWTVGFWPFYSGVILAEGQMNPTFPEYKRCFLAR